MAEFNLEGLLGNVFGGGGGNALDEYLTPEQRAAMQRNAMLAASAALLKAGGESTRRIGIGEAIGGAFEAGQAGYEKAQTGALTQMAMKQKMEDAKKAKELQKMVGGVFAPQAATPTPEVDTNVPTGAGAAMQPAQAAARPINPNAARANQYRQAAQMLNMAGQTEQAMKYEDLALKLDPTNAPSDKAKLLAELGLPMTRENLELLESSPNEIKLLNKMGVKVTMENVERIRRAGATNVRVGGPILENAEQKGMGEFNIKNFSDASAAAALAQKTLPSLDVQSQILNKGFTTGFGTEVQKAGASVLAALGVPEANRIATDAQTFLAATQQAVLQKQLEQKGPQTEADARRITDTGAQLGNTVDANRFIIDVAKEQLKRDIKRKEFLESWWATNKTLRGADDAWYSGAGGQSLFDSPGLKKYVASGTGGFKYLGKESK
jgi:hypothetical protein